MEQRNDYMAAGGAIFAFQLAFMREAMALASQGAQRMLELGRAAASAADGALPAATPTPVDPKDLVTAAAALASASTKRAARFSDLRFATTARLASANREYVERMQENVDSMLHALAMAPVAADRFIRTTAAATERPLNAQQAAPAKPGAPKARRPRRSDHAQ